MPDATHTFDLTTFGLSDMTACGAGLRGAAADADSFEDAAGRIVGFLRDRFLDASGAPACALVRCFHTLPFGELDADDQRFARARLPDGPRLLVATDYSFMQFDDEERAALGIEAALFLALWGVVVVGFSSLRGIYRDILQAAPLIGGFAALNNSANN